MESRLGGLQGAWEALLEPGWMVTLRGRALLAVGTATSGQSEHADKNWAMPELLWHLARWGSLGGSLVSLWGTAGTVGVGTPSAVKGGQNLGPSVEAAEPGSPSWAQQGGQWGNRDRMGSQVPPAPTHVGV